MKAVLHTRYGPPDVLQIGDIPTPEPGKGELRIRVVSSTVTSGDARVRRADPPLVRLFFGLLKPKHRVPGFEYAGIVEKTGTGTSRFQKGDRVFGVSGLTFGALAEYLVVREESPMANIPEGWTFSEAATIPFGAGTSRYFLQDKGELQSGQRVLVHGASGGVGTAAVQIARLLGAKVEGVCGPANLERIRSLGADQVLNYQTETPPVGRYDLIFDAAGKLDLRQAIPWLAPGGRIVSVTRGYAKDRAEDYPFFVEWMSSGALRAVIDREYPLEEITAAHRHVDSGHKAGSVVIRVASDE